MGNAERDRDGAVGLVGLPVFKIPGGDGRADLLGEDAGAGQFGLGQNHGEFLASEARGDIPAFHATLEGRSHEPEHLVPDEMTVGIVELLEIINIRQQDAKRAAVFLGFLQYALQRRIEGLAIGNFRQGIGE